MKKRVIKVENYLGEQEMFLLIPIRLYRSSENLGGVILPLEKKVNLGRFDFILLRILLSAFINHWQSLILQENKAASIKAEVRSKLAQDIHDGLAQQLFYLSAQVFQIKNNFAKGNMDQLDRLLGVMEQQTRSCQNEVRDFISQLKGERRESNIHDAIGKLVKRLTYHTPVKVSVEYFGEYFVESVAIEETIYRIIEETVNNSLKHAKATAITVHVEATIVQWTIKINDDGIGFVPFSKSQPDRYGLNGLRERVTEMGGHITLSSHPGKGTEIVAVIPREGLKAYV